MARYELQELKAFAEAGGGLWGALCVCVCVIFLFVWDLRGGFGLGFPVI